MEARREFVVKGVFEGYFLPLYLLEPSHSRDDQVAVHLGLRKLQWLFLTCHNFWIIFRLTKVGDDMILAYSPMLDISSSSIPFRAYLGAVLSAVRGFPVNPTVITVGTILDTLPEEDEGEDSTPEDMDDDGSGEYTYTGHGNKPPRSRNKAAGNYDLKVCFLVPCLVENNWICVQFTASPANSSNTRWIYLRSISPDSFTTPSLPPAWDRTVRITNLLGVGSTGVVFQGSIGKKLVAVKIVEALHRDDGPRRQRLRSEFAVYAHLEQLYNSGNLPRCIAPRCYGAFESKRLDILVMGLHGRALSDWSDLKPSER
jgi:hypothetical protein